MGRVRLNSEYIPESLIMLGCKVPVLSNLQKSNDLFDDVMSDLDEEAKDE